MKPFSLVLGCVTAALGLVVSAQQPAQPSPVPAWVTVRPIEPPGAPLPSEAASAGVTRFSFIAYGDTRNSGVADVPGDGQIPNPEHSRVVDRMIARIHEDTSSPFPVRFVLQSGDAVVRGQNGAMWNVSFTPVVEKLTRGANIPVLLFRRQPRCDGHAPGRSRPRPRLVQHADGEREADSAGRVAAPPERLSDVLFRVRKRVLHRSRFEHRQRHDSTRLGHRSARASRSRTFLTSSRSFITRCSPPARTAVRQPSRLPGTGTKSARSYRAAERCDQIAVRSTLQEASRADGHYRATITSSTTGSNATPAGGVTYRMDSLVTGGGGAPTYRYAGEPDLRAYTRSGRRGQCSRRASDEARLDA